MRSSRTDVDFSDPAGFGKFIVEDVPGEDLVRLTIDKHPRGQQFPGVAIHGTLTEAQARKLRDALDAWLRRREPVVEIVDPTRW